MKKYFYLLFFIGIIFSVASAYAAPCQFVSVSDTGWGIGRIENVTISIGNSSGCPNGFGEMQGSILINNVSADVTSWYISSVSANTPSSIEGLANIEVIGSDGLVYGTTQLLISLKVDSCPSEITLGDRIEITGNFANTPGSEDINSDSWPGRVVNLSVGGYNSPLSLVSWADDRIIISTSEFGFFKVGINTLKVFYGSSHVNNGYQSRSFDINIKAPHCTANSWQCSNWDSCSLDGIQERTCEKMGWGNSVGLYYCEGGEPSPATTQICTPPCTTDDWSCDDWSVCSQSGTQTRTCTKTANCQGGTSFPAISQSCTYIPPCISFYYSSWSECWTDGTQTRSITYKYPSNCEGGESPKTARSCTYIPSCTADTWICGNWNSCSANGIQSRICTKTFDCPTVITPSPPTSQNCTPPCNADTWTCGGWGSCSPSGTQTRSCRKTFDCPSVETATPETVQYCTPPNLDKYQVSPIDQQVVNQDNIIKSTVNLWCPLNKTWYSVGSGTIIDSKGTILTNKHVVSNTEGCLVGFVDSYKDEPYFGDRHIADISRVSTNADVAILKLRNPHNRTLTYIDISSGNSDVLRLGDKISTYGYPTKFGSKITSTRGEFSGVEEDFLKTTAIIDKGNSGGGAYLQNGYFIGIPTKVFVGSFNVLGGILSVNKVKSWLSNTSITYDDESYNKYSRVSSILENVDLQKLDSFKLYLGGDIPEEPNETEIEDGNNQVQRESVVVESDIIESDNSNQEIDSEQDNLVPLEKEEKPKVSWFKRFFQWISNTILGWFR